MSAFFLCKLIHHISHTNGCTTALKALQEGILGTAPILNGCSTAVLIDSPASVLNWNLKWELPLGTVGCCTAAGRTTKIKKRAAHKWQCRTAALPFDCQWAAAVALLKIMSGLEQ